MCSNHCAIILTIRNRGGHNAQQRHQRGPQLSRRHQAQLHQPGHQTALVQVVPRPACRRPPTRYALPGSGNSASGRRQAGPGTGNAGPECDSAVAPLFRWPDPPEHPENRRRGALPCRCVGRGAVSRRVVRRLRRPAWPGRGCLPLRACDELLDAPAVRRPPGKPGGSVSRPCRRRQRTRHHCLHLRVLAKRVEVPRTGLSILLLGQRHHPCQHDGHGQRPWPASRGRRRVRGCRGRRTAGTAVVERGQLLPRSGRRRECGAGCDQDAGCSRRWRSGRGTSHRVPRVQHAAHRISPGRLGGGCRMARIR